MNVDKRTTKVDMRRNPEALNGSYREILQMFTFVRAPWTHHQVAPKAVSLENLAVPCAPASSQFGRAACRDDPTGR